MDEDHTEETPESIPESKPEPSAAATALETRVPKRRWYRRVRWRVVVARVVLWGIVAAAVLALILYTAVRVFVKADDIRNLVKDLVEEQTGGKMEIGQAEFNVLSGVKLSNVQFYPPATGDTRGFKYGGAINLVPLANFEALDVRYSIPKLFAAKIHLKALQLIGPEFHLKQTDGVFNFDSILKYREVKFPPDPAKVEEKQEEQADSGNELLPFSPALIYMPVELLTQNIGIKNLRLDMLKEEKGQITQILMTNGLSFDCGVHWFGRKSNIWFDMMSPFERPFELSVQDVARNEQGEPVGDLKQSVIVKTALVLHFAFENLQKINMDFATRLLEVETPVAGYHDIGTLVKMRLSIADDYKSVNFDTFDFSLAEAMAYELRGNVAIPSGNIDVINLKLKQKFSLDLKEAAKLAKPFVPGLAAEGEISFDDLKIEGQVEPAKLANIDKGIALPYVSGVIWLEDVAANLAGLGVSMEPLSGDVSLAMGPSLNGSGSQVDLAVNMDIPKIEIEQDAPKVGKVRAGVAGLTTKVTVRALWPEMIAPILKVNAEAEHVTASGTGIAPLDVPLFADIDADGRADLSRLAFSSNVELTDLLEFSAMADCQAKCTKFRSSMNGRMDSLQKLHSIALPLGGVLNMKDVMPTKLTGAVDFQFSARGKLPDPLTTPPLDILKQADLRFNSQLNLAKLSADVPMLDVKLKNFETRVLASGTLAEQKIDLSQKFESVSLALPPSPEAYDADENAKGMAVSVTRYSLETNVNNEIEGAIDLDRILKQLKTDVETHLYIGKVAVEGGPLPRPISDVSVNVAMSQAHLEDIKLKEVVVKLPDFGTSVTVKADTSVGPDFMPKRLWTKIVMNVIHSGEERLPLGLKTSGKVDVNLEIDTKDMRNVAIDGETSFDRFNVLVPAADPKAPPLIEIEGMKGAIPFKQNIQIPDLASLKKPAETPKQEAGAAQVVVVEAPKTEPKKDEIPDVQVVDEDDEGGERADEKLDKLAGQYFTKNEDKLAASANPVATVDYPNIRPFYPERRPLSIDRLEAANLELIKMEFDLELRQNFFAVNQFVIGFLGGKIQGDFQLAFDAAAKDLKKILLGLRTTVHMTRLDTRKLLERFPNLKDKTSSVFGFSNPYLDGTVHFKYDLLANDMSGGIEITSIGKEQLKMMLFYVDPFEQNPTISDMRKALSFGEVRQVSIPIKNGEIGIDVDVRLVSVPFPTPKLSRFPISQLIDNIKDQLLPKTDEKPAEPKPTPPPVPEVTPQVSGA